MANGLSITKSASLAVLTTLVLISGSELATSQSAPTDCGTPKQYVQKCFRSVVIVSDKILGNGRFSFKKTIEKMVENTRTKPVVLVKSLLETFRETSKTNGKVSMKITPLETIANISPAQLLDPNSKYGLVPTAIFNRLDLAPESYDNCGEFRIVYSFKKPLETDDKAKRFFLIFESRPTNPASPVNKASELVQKAACQTVARFWANLPKLGEAEIATRLARFFYEGKINENLKFPKPVIHREYLGLITGQVRGNFKANIEVGNRTKNIWQLREWGLVKSSPDKFRFSSKVLGNSPLTELHQNKDHFTNDAETAKLANLFKTEFWPIVAKALMTPPKMNASRDSNWLINNLGLPFENGEDEIFNEFQNIAAPNELLDHITLTEPKFGEFNDRTTGILAKNKPVNQDISNQQLLNRARVLTCRGCHQTFGLHRLGAITPLGAAISQKIRWPSNTQFVHAHEPQDKDGQLRSSRLSTALKDVFLRFRRDQLNKFVALNITPPTTASMVRTPNPVARISNIFRKHAKRIDNARFKDLARKFARRVRQYRERSAKEPGAFVRYRRTH